MRDNDEKPQWLLDADEEVKESKKMKVDNFVNVSVTYSCYLI